MTINETNVGWVGRGLNTDLVPRISPGTEVKTLGTSLLQFPLTTLFEHDEQDYRSQRATAFTE